MGNNNQNSNGSSFFSKLLIAAICIAAARTVPNLSQHIGQIKREQPRVYNVLQASKTIQKVSDFYHDYFVVSIVTLPETNAWVSIGAFGAVWVFQESAYERLPMQRPLDSTEKSSQRTAYPDTTPKSVIVDYHEAK